MADGPEKPRLDVLAGFFNSLVPGGPPTLDRARAALGGPWVGGAEVGGTVRVQHMPGSRVGVVIHASPAERDLWIGEGRIQRVAVEATEPLRRDDPAAPDRDLAAVAADALVHASLSVGQRVRFQRRDGSLGEGVIAEKLRYGSLVGLSDGRVMAVSFRRVAPLAEGGTQ